MSLPKITAHDAKRLIDKGALLIDIRGADEHARECIPGARNCPVNTMEKLGAGAGPVVFYCRSGNRTAVNSGRLAAAAGCEAYAIEGGIDAWKLAGLPVRTDHRQPIEVQRQVQLVAGSLVLLGVLLGQFVHPAFDAVAGFVGAGLVFAGLTGWCGMAKLLDAMPWNRRAARLAAA
jgi:rhodanese-related sulfurtransferase